MVIWITGRAGAGKTTLAYKMAYTLSQKGERVLILDGNNIRKWFPDTGWSDEDRWKHIDTVARYAAIAEEQGITVIVELISPKKEWRMKTRLYFKEYQLIYCPGGTLWPGTEYEEPDKEEITHCFR